MPKGRPKTADIFVSVIILCDKASGGVVRDVKAVSALLKVRYSNYEILVIDNGMLPGEVTRLEGVLAKIACIRVVRLSRTVPKDTAVFVGLESAIGDRVVLYSHGQDSPQLIPDFIQATDAADIVFGLSNRTLRKGAVNKYGAKAFYWYNKRYLGLHIPSNSTYYMALNRPAVNALTRNDRQARHVRYLARQIGYTMTDIAYDPLPTAEPEKKSLPKLLVSALELTTNYSKFPLRFVAWLGLFAAFINLLYGGYVIVIRLVKSQVAEGWTTLSMQSAVMFFFLFLILAVISEYLGKVLEESRGDPAYHIMDELNSTVSVADATRRNIAR